MSYAVDFTCASYSRKPLSNTHLARIGRVIAWVVSTARTALFAVVNRAAEYRASCIPVYNETGTDMSASAIDLISSTTAKRVAALRRGRQLEYFTIVWNSLEAVIALVAGLVA